MELEKSPATLLTGFLGSGDCQEGGSGARCGRRSSPTMIWREMFKPDGTATMTDAKNLALHIDECREQIAFGDAIVLKKTELVSEADLDLLEARRLLTTDIAGTWVSWGVPV